MAATGQPKNKLDRRRGKSELMPFDGPCQGPHEAGIETQQLHLPNFQLLVTAKSGDSVSGCLSLASMRKLLARVQSRAVASPSIITGHFYGS